MEELFSVSVAEGGLGLMPMQVLPPLPDLRPLLMPMQVLPPLPDLRPLLMASCRSHPPSPPSSHAHVRTNGMVVTEKGE